MQISKELIAPARITAPANRSIPPVTLRNIWRPYHETGENRPIVTIVHNSTLVLVGMIFILSSTLVLQYLCTIVSLYYSIFVLQYTSTIVGLYYSTFVLQYNCIVVRLYYSIFVLQYTCTIENDSHSQ